MRRSLYPPFPSHPVDWFLFDLATPAMKDVFNERKFIETVLKVEVVLAQAQSELGVIPRAAASAISEKASFKLLDLNNMRNRVEVTGGHFLVAIIESWRKKIGEQGEWLHWGATTQDIVDTAMVLLIREANQQLMRDLLEIKKSTMRLAKLHKTTPIAGRTHAVHAVPMTFGLKVSVWLDEIVRNIQRLREIERRLYVGNLTGAVGTFASLGTKGPNVQELTLKKLGLRIPNVCWHAARDRFAEYINLLALIASTLSKVALQVILLTRTETGELEEPVPPGHVGSSTMPQKRNPVMSEISIALARLVRANAHAMTESMETFDERGFNTWFAEFVIIPESCLLVSQIAYYLKTTLESLVVHPDKMRDNLLLSGGSINAEAIMMALAPKMGRQRAHHLVRTCALESQVGNKSFERVLLEDKVIRKHLTEVDIKRLLDPVSYIGQSSKLVDKVITANSM